MKNLIALVVITYFCSSYSFAETYKNTNDQQNGKTFGQLMTWVFDGEKSPERVEIETSNQWQELAPDQTNYAVWVGHATYLINNGDINILTDPIFSKRASPIGFAGPKRMIPPAMQLNDLPKIDAVVVSHNHYDHFDIWSLKKLYKLNPETIFMIPVGDKKKLIKAGIKNVVEMNWWESLKVSNTTFHFTPVQHWSKRGLFDRNKSLWGGWFMQTDALALYHAGDTGYSNDFKTTYERLGAPDYSFIPIGAYDPRWFMKDSHVNPEEAVQIALDLKTSYSFGMHWGTFTLTDEPVLEPPVRLERALVDQNLEPDFFRSPKPGEILQLIK
ncbi:MBL fold metallo-hydrolase [Gammaproteobacteria bacterium]|jgi:N-acyl-phosphatidylethanolamine-hydrolysing phospholipase D|nr:MBL fold metallo-hydrolase [Gammaproteobacteria bacterium]